MGEKGPIDSLSRPIDTGKWPGTEGLLRLKGLKKEEQKSSFTCVELQMLYIF